MDDWTAFISEVQNHVSILGDTGCDIQFVRGHSNAGWKLLCGLGRRGAEILNPNLDVKGTCFEHFISEEKKFPADILAINPTHAGHRLSV